MIVIPLANPFSVFEHGALPANWQEWFVDVFAACPFFAQAIALMLLAIALQYVAATGAAPFIYTKF